MTKKRPIVLFISLLGLVTSTIAENQPPPGLIREMERKIEIFHGEVGLYFKNLTTGETITISAQDTFPTASLIKIPIAIHVFNKIEKEEVGYLDKWIYRDSLSYGGAGYLQFFKDSTSLNVKDLVHLMLTVSDNTAAIWLTKNLGKGDAINVLMDSLGLYVTRMNSYSIGREAFWNRYGWGMTTPEEMGTLMEKIFLKQILTPESCEEIYRILTHSYWDGYAPSQVPMTMSVASKTGALNDYRAEVACINTPKFDYIVCIITNHNEDKRWVKMNEADKLIIELNQMIFDYYHPDYLPEIQMSRDKFQSKF